MATEARGQERHEPAPHVGFGLTDVMLLGMALIWGVNFSVVKYGTQVVPALAFNGGLTVHVNVVGGRDPHHIAEAEYKAFARAFRQAKALDPLVEGIPSTKGAL